MKKLSTHDIKDILKLTPMQEGMLFHFLKEPESTQYIEQLSLEMAGEIDCQWFKKAWNFVVHVNPALRTVFRWEKMDNPVQIVLKTFDLQPEFHDLTFLESTDKQKYLNTITTRLRSGSFDLSVVAFKICLCKMEADQFVMIITHHHILFDGWSTGIILKEFFSAYHDLYLQKELQEPTKTNFKEFLQCLKHQNKDMQKNYWQDYFKDYECSGELGIKKHLRKITQEQNPGKSFITYRTSLGETGKAALESFCQAHSVTPASVLYMAWGVLLQKYNNRDDVVFGTTVSGRPSSIKGIEAIIGLFINTLPLRIRGHKGETLLDLLAGINSDLQNRGDFENTPLVDIKTYSGLAPSAELFDTLLAIENYPLDNSLRECRGNLRLGAFKMEARTHYDLSIGIMLFGKMAVEIAYNADCFDTGSIEQMAIHFSHIIATIIANIRQNPLATSIEIMTDEEKQRLLYDFNLTTTAFPHDKTIPQLFLAQVEKTPHHTAVIFGDSRYTYKELHVSVGLLVRRLRAKGVGPNTIVGLLAERSVEMIVGILGILSAGGAYLPIDPGFPMPRVMYMLADSSTKLLVTTLIAAEKIPPVTEIISVQEVLSPASEHALQEYETSTHAPTFREADATDLAYIIYTSGSTGNPKGVLIRHYSVIRLVRNTNYIAINQEDCLLQLANYAFDVSVFDIFGALLNGAALVLVPQEKVSDVNMVAEVIVRNGITILAIPAALFNVVVDLKIACLKSVRRILVGGEQMSLAHCRKALEYLGKGRLINAYGPTETTVQAICNIITGIDQNAVLIPIGCPIANTTVYILDRHRHVVPINCVGEIYIGGAGNAAGYLNNPVLTAEKFVENPFMAVGTTQLTNETLYKSGDLARWLPDGTIEFLGRIDQQVKIRGFRIELGEIENRLLSHEEINEAVVLLRTDNGAEKYLCGYIVPKIAGVFAQRTTFTQELKNFLAEVLPEHMIPPYFMPLEKMPLTANGKIDRHALSHMPLAHVTRGNVHVAPRTSLEEKLAEIWKLILSAGNIGIDDNFFELGGHSLRATVLVSRISKELGVTVPLAQLFKTPTIRSLAEYIRVTAQGENYVAIEPVEKKEYYEMSSAQKRLFIIQQMDLESMAYNITDIIPLRDEITCEKLEKTFQMLIARHESFRTSFFMMDATPVQKIHDHVALQLDYFPDAAFHDVIPIIRGFVKPFVLTQAPLLRVGLIESREKGKLLLINMHHIISDGVSLKIVVADLTAIDENTFLPFLPLQYKDFAVWQNNRKAEGKMNAQEVYWLHELSGEIPVLNLLLDYPRPAMQSFAGHTLHFEVDVEHTAALKTITAQSSSTFFMVLLAVTDIWLAKLSSQEDIIIGTPIASRRHADLENIIGMFVNTLALRNYPMGNKSFRQFLDEVNARSLAAFENQEYPFEDLLDRVAVLRDVRRNPLFDIMFTFDTLSASLPFQNKTPVLK